MGALSKLTDENFNVHLLLTSSDLAEIYVYDILKARCKATLESVLTVNTRSEFKGMSELVSMQPNLAEKWLVVMDYTKVKTQLKAAMGVLQSETAIFLLKVKNYAEFKELKKLYPQMNDIYLNSIRRYEVVDLLRPYQLSTSLQSYVATAYFNDPERVFTLVRELKNGAVVQSSSDVVALCGESMNSIQKFTMLLLTDTPKTQMFLKRSYKKRVSNVCDLCETFTCETAYNFISSALKDIMYIKMLYLQGVIYDRVYDLPEAFDESKLARYGFYLKEISQGVSYERILWVYSELRNFGRWKTTQDAVLFLYKFYLALIDKAKGVA